MSALEIRKYQTEARDAVISQWDSGQRKTLLVLPTGCGKTIVFTDILKTCLKENEKALVLAHTGELLTQAMDKIKRFGGLDTSLEKANNTAVGSECPVVVGSVQTLCRQSRLNQYPKDYFQYIVVDEAHHCMSDSYKKVLNYFESAKILGVTATPKRGDKQKLENFFNSRAYEYEFKNAVKDGFLCPIKTETVQLEIDLTKVKMQNGDFAAGDVGITLDTHLTQIAKVIAKKCANRKTVVFLPLVATAERFCEILNKQGISAGTISGKSTNREEILDNFKKGEYKVLCNAMLLTEGWDCPEVDCVVVLRPTRSDALYRQMVGRGCRTAVNKNDLLLLDFLWLTKKIDLMHPTDLLDCDDEIAKRIKQKASRKTKATDLFDLEQEAEKDYQAEIEESLRRELEEAERRAAAEPRHIQCEQFMHEIGKVYRSQFFKEYKSYRNVMSIELSDKQIAELYRLGLNNKEIKSLTGDAAYELIGFLQRQRRLGRCTYKQAKILHKNGYDPSVCNVSEASIAIGRIFREQGYKGNSYSKKPSKSKKGYSFYK